MRKHRGGVYRAAVSDSLAIVGGLLYRHRLDPRGNPREHQ
jgi:hypothetical protein